MILLNRNVGVRRLAIVLSIAGAAAGSAWEYKNSDFAERIRDYRWARAEMVARPHSRLVPHDDGSVHLVAVTPAAAASPTQDLGGGWTTAAQPAHGEETEEISTLHFPTSSDLLLALLVVALAAAVPFAVVHAAAWVVQGFRAEDR